MKRLIDSLGTILLFIGFFFAFLPHVFHATVGFSEQSHLKHIIFGVILVIISLGILVYNNKALKFMN